VPNRFHFHAQSFLNLAASHNGHIWPLLATPVCEQQAFHPSQKQSNRKIMAGKALKYAAITFVLLAIITAIPVAASAQSGIASIYSYSGTTASGEHAASGGLTAAHRSLPFGTLVRVTNEANGRSVVVRINDRGPFVKGRVIDVTPTAAAALGFSGLAHVSLDVVGHS
jgi:rare lipoprotein A